MVHSTCGCEAWIVIKEIDKTKCNRSMVVEKNVKLSMDWEKNKWTSVKYVILFFLINQPYEDKGLNKRQKRFGVYWVNFFLKAARKCNEIHQILSWENAVLSTPKSISIFISVNNLVLPLERSVNFFAILFVFTFY